MSGYTSATFQPMAWGSYMGVSGRTSNLGGNNYRYNTNASYDGNGGRLNINLSHTHNVFIGSSDTETKPADFTKKIWVRTA